MINNRGYIQYPSLHKDVLFFVSGETIWSAKLTNCSAHMEPQRITDKIEDLGAISVSKCGKYIAYIADKRLYCMDSNGGMLKQIIFDYDVSSISGWDDDNNIIFASSSKKPFSTMQYLYKVSYNGGIPIELSSFGIANRVSYGNNMTAIQTGGYGYISWKQYKGGETAKIFIDKNNDGNFVKLIDNKYNLLSPTIIGNKVFFLSDMNKIGNIFSIDLDANSHDNNHDNSIKQHTFQNKFYARHMSNYDNKIVYTASGNVFIYDTLSQTETELDIKLPIYNQDTIVFKNPVKHLSSYAVSNSGKRVVVSTAGKLFAMTPWKGSITQVGEKDCISYIHPVILDDSSIAVVKHYLDDDKIEIHNKDSSINVYSASDYNITSFGRIKGISLYKKEYFVLLNTKNELFIVNISANISSNDTNIDKQAKLIDKSDFNDIKGISLSNCGKWIAYDVSKSINKSEIRIYNTIDETVHTVLSDGFNNFSPSFDIDGKFLYFLSERSIDVDDHDVCAKPFLMSLQKDTLSPFISVLLKDDDDYKEDSKKDSKCDKKEEAKEDKNEASEEKKEYVTIDFDNISNRIENFPVEHGKYAHLIAIKGKILYTEIDDEKDSMSMHAYDMSSLKSDMVLSKITGFTISNNREWIVYKNADTIRVIPAGTKPVDEPSDTFHGNGVVDLYRIVLNINKFDEWNNIFDEAWKLQKEFFWKEDMNGIDWNSIRDKYKPMLSRISSTKELFDIINDMHGELESSHAYIYAEKRPTIEPGFLGASFEYDVDSSGYKITNIYNGDNWDNNNCSPLLKIGNNIKNGDILLSICGEKLSKENHPAKTLFNHSGNMIQISVSDHNLENKRNIVVKVLPSEKEIIYRNWVESNRAYVKQKTDDKIGYIHIPDMSSRGLKEFFRYFDQEFDKEGLIIDARFNGGGNVSPIIISALSTKRIGYDKTRNYGNIPHPHSPKGPMVALINGSTGSDGDIFANAFKLLKLGPTIGKRTWGGVIGICPRYPLIDNTMTTQPEYSYWCIENGWNIENHGVDPDIEIDIMPHDYANGIDPQLDKGIEEVLNIVNSDTNQKIQKKLTPVC